VAEGAAASGGVTETRTDTTHAGGDIGAGGRNSFGGTTHRSDTASNVGAGSTITTSVKSGAGGNSTSSGTGRGGSNSGGTAHSSGASAIPGGSTGITNTDTAPPSTGLPEASATGYGRATTGGGNQNAMEVSSLAAAQAAVDAYSGSGGLVLRYTGKFDFASLGDPCTQWSLDAQLLEIKNKNDISILGADGSAAHFGIRIVANSSNIIIRNMTIGLTAGGDSSDMISIEGNSSGFPQSVWIDHNTLFSSMVECSGASDVEFDGMIDVKKGADNVTVSYNYLHDHHKVSLNGYSDSDTAVRHITFHHNLFENVGSRTPLQRGGYSHLLNNYFSNVQVSGINVRVNGYSLIEGNYFESVVNPVTSRDSDSIGYWDLRNNNLATKADVAAGNPFGITWTAGDSGTVNATDWTTTKAYPIALGYSYVADPANCVHAGLRAVAGAGKRLATLKCP
jgi:pectate lyase